MNRTFNGMQLTSYWTGMPTNVRRTISKLDIPDATTPVVAAALDQRVFYYLGMPEQIHTNQGAQIESSLMTEDRWLWGANKTRTTPYHPLGQWSI